jgi:DNA-binding MarR family transcriptional regulator
LQHPKIPKEQRIDSVVSATWLNTYVADAAAKGSEVQRTQHLNPILVSGDEMSSHKGALSEPLSKKDLEAMSEFRYRLRRFLRFSEEATRAAGVTPLQYQLMLQVRGFPGRSWATVGELAERLQAAPNGTAALVSRCETAGLVIRKPGDEDRRQVRVHLTIKGERCLLKLAALHKPEIASFGWTSSNTTE